MAAMGLEGDGKESNGWKELVVGRSVDGTGQKQRGRG